MTLPGQTQRRADEVLRDFARMRSEVSSVAEAAVKMGMTPRALEKVLERARARGDQRGYRGDLPALTQIGRKEPSKRQGPTVKVTPSVDSTVLDEWVFLREAGEHWERAAQRLGIARRTFYDALQAARAEGDPRGALDTEAAVQMKFKRKKVSA